MDQPQSKILDQIVAILEDRREMERAVAGLRERANDLAAKLAHEDDKELAAAYLYWMYPEIKATVLTKAVTGQSQVQTFLDQIHAVTDGTRCDRCDCLIPIKSRAQLNDHNRNRNRNRNRTQRRYSTNPLVSEISILCDLCQDIRDAERNEQWEAEREVREARLSELRNMPYREYLQTPEWREKREHHLRSAGYRCQVCNSPEKPLDVHHRTYKRRGQEYYKDLILLCRTCHGIFHDSGKLYEG